MKRILAISIATLVAVSALGAGLASAKTVATVGTHKTSVGTILVDARGFTIYTFSKDARNQDACIKINGCIALWTPVTASGKPVAGAGVKASLLGSILIKGGKQVTYAGHPLYTYTGDSHPAETDYVNTSQSGGIWLAVSPSGAR